MLNRATIEQYIADHIELAQVYCAYVHNEKDLEMKALYLDIARTHKTISRDYQRLLERMNNA